MENKSPSFIRQKLELLSLNPSFKNDVFDFREKWKIPKNGFKDNEGIKKYEEWLSEISDEYRDSKPYNKKRRSLFDKLDKATRKGDRRLYKKLEEEIKRLEMLMPLNDFFNDQKSMAIKYGLSENYKNILDVFLRSGNFYPLYISGLPIRTWYENDSANKGKKKIFIEVYAETTIKDIQKIWPMIKHWQKNTIGFRKGRKRRKTELVRDLRIYELYLGGLTHPKISKKIREEFGGQTIMYDEIAKIIQRMKKSIMDR